MSNVTNLQSIIIYLEYDTSFVLRSSKSVQPLESQAVFYMLITSAKLN